MLSFVEGIGSSEEKELVRQVVERGAETMQRLGDQRCDLGGNIKRLLQVKECVSGLRIELRNDSICTFFDPGPHLPFEITALFFGPFNAL